MNSLSKLESVFFSALEKGPGQERAALLDTECSGDVGLRQQVEKMLAAQISAGSFLEEPLQGLDLDNTQAFAGIETRDDAVVNEAAVSLDFLRPSNQTGSMGRIGAYEVQSVVGRGGMGIVLKAQDTRLNRTVAVKVMAPELAANVTARKRFLREAQAAAAVVHPHVVTIHAVDEDRLPFLVMELVHGTSLRDKIEQAGTLPVAEIISIGSQIASGLAAAHIQGLIHRDIKPANILLVNGVQRVKVTDFGLARAVDDSEITQTGELAGTPQYMSPEQARGDSLDARSDLFSLGSVLYAMCTGRSPFRADRAIAVIRRVCDDTPRPIREVNPDIPDWLCALINRLLAKNPADRPQSAQEVADLLNRRPHAPREVPVSRRETTTMAGQGFTLRWPLIATAAAGFLLASLGIWVIIKDKHGHETARIEVPDGASVTIETEFEVRPTANLEKNDPKNGYLVYTRRGFAHSQLGQFELALADFRAAYDLAPQQTLTVLSEGFRGGGTAWNQAQFDDRLKSGVVALFDRYVEDQKRSIAARASAANWLAELKQFDAARRHLEANEAVGAKGWFTHYCLAILALQRGDVDDYRRVCRAMLAQAAHSPNEESPKTWAFIGYVCGLGPRGLDDYDSAIDFARRGLAKQPASATCRRALGQVLYRAGHFEEAHKLLQASLETKEDQGGETVFSSQFLAMADHHLGRPDDAKRWLRKADAVGTSYYNWRFHLIRQMLHQEATQLLASKPGLPEASLNRLFKTTRDHLAPFGRLERTQ